MIIRNLRQDRGWSQEDLAQVSGVSVRTIQRIENGGRASLETLKCLAAVFETPIPELRKDAEMTEKKTEKPVELEEPRQDDRENDPLTEKDRAALRYVHNLMRYDDWSDDWEDGRSEKGRKKDDKGVHIRVALNDDDDDLDGNLPPEERLIRRQVRRERAFYRNLMTYTVIIGFLAIVNLLTSPGYLWFLWAAGGWGLALVLHAASVFGKQRLLGDDWERREVERRLQRLARRSGQVRESR